MTPTDEQIERLITDCKLMADALQCDGQTMRGAHVFNAMVALQRARSEAVASDLEAKRWERAKTA